MTRSADTTRMRSRLLLGALASLTLTVPAHANPTVTHPDARGWLHADKAAQHAAEWMFPHAAHPFGTVTRRRGCDLQKSVAYLCTYDLAVWSSGRWTGQRAPANVEQWRCSGPISIMVSQSRTRDYGNPCRPDNASDAADARLLFVAAVHRHLPARGRVRSARCRDALTLTGPPFVCTATPRRSGRVVGDVDQGGAVTFGSAPTGPEDAGVSEPGQPDGVAAP